MTTEEQRKIYKAIALIRGGLNSLSFSAPENAYMFYKRFEEAAKILEKLSITPLDILEDISRAR